jgi:hypothetical protein
MNDNVAENSSMPFTSKKWTTITDSTSNSGSFSGNQIQFDLSTLASQSDKISLKEAVVSFPVKVYAKITTAGTGAETTKTIATVHSTIIKNSWNSYINSCQLVINGNTVQNANNYQNVATSFKLLSEWGQDDVQKWGSTIGFALDDCSADGDSTSTYTTNIGFSNAGSGIATSTRGLDVINNQSVLYNKGIQTRMNMLNNDVTGSTFQKAVTDAATMTAAGVSNVAYVAAGSNTLNDIVYSACYVANVRLRDLVDLEQFPLVSNLKGYLYLYCNAATVTLTGTAASTAIASVDVNVYNGQSCPILVNTSATGIILGQYATTPPVVTITAEVSGSSSNLVSLSGHAPIMTSARLSVPYYTPTPAVARTLENSAKPFSMLEKIVNPFYVSSKSSINFTIVSGIPNAKKLILVPLLQGLGGSTKFTNPEISCFDTVPMTSSPFATLTNLNVFIGNKPVFNQPIMYNYDEFIQQVSDTGLYGGQSDNQTSGLISEQLFNQNHRFYYFDLSRREIASNGASQSVQVQCTNATSYGMKVIAILFHEKNYVIDTSLCQIQSV